LLTPENYFLEGFRKNLARIDACVTTDMNKHPDLLIVEELVLVSEDRQFFSHRGIDPRACARELWKAIRMRRHGGASTIDMQFVRTATGCYQKTLRRKLREMLLARLIQHRYSKIEILRNYLGIAFFGSGLHGLDAACTVMFSKKAAELNVEEAAVIAAMLIYPRPLKPTPVWVNSIGARAQSILLAFQRRDGRRRVNSFGYLNIVRAISPTKMGLVLRHLFRNPDRPSIATMEGEPLAGPLRKAAHRRAQT
jgi:hypothetical protein